MATVSQAARMVSASPSAIRNWSKEFGEYLSPGASPPKGKPRSYNADDIAVFLTIVTLREQQASTDDIHATLAAGQRLEPLPTDEDDTDQGAEEPAIGQRQALQVLQQRVTDLDTRVESLTAQLIDAEKRAAAAEAKLELIQGKPQEQGKPDKPMSFAEWWRQRF